MKCFCIFVVTLCLIGACARSVAQSSKPRDPGEANGHPVHADGLADRKLYAGDQICAQCHQNQVQSFHQTAHYLTSRLPDEDSILGKFTPGANVIMTSNPELSFRMENRQDGFF